MLCRYPGSKDKLQDFIVDKLLALFGKVGFDAEYREPFFGAGSIGIHLLERNTEINSIWINDYDEGIASLWTSIIIDPETLIHFIEQCKPDTHMFYDYKRDLQTSKRKISAILGFKKLVAHQISYSGLGTMSGGPLGGKDQRSAYDILCRWKPLNIISKIKKANKILKSRVIHNNQCTMNDFEKLFESGKFVIYCDPPYYVKGPELYQYSFSKRDHRRLSQLLESCDQPWILSYDECPEIRKLYKWATIYNLDIKYTVNTSGKKSDEHELLIVPNRYKDILEQTTEDLFA